MKAFFFYLDPESHSFGWLPPEAAVMRVFAGSLGARMLSMPGRPQGTKNALVRRATEWRIRNRERDALCKEVADSLERGEQSILFQMAFTAWDLQCARLLEPVWDRFSHRVLYINDTIKPDPALLDDLKRFDEILCFCGDLTEEYRALTGLPCTYWPAHSDVLNYHSVGDHRPIDLMVVGRRDSHWHPSLHRHFNDPKKERVFVDFVSRTQGVQPARDQFDVLMATYGKAKGSFCYEPSAVPRFQDRSPVLNRWVHAWSSGNAVFGTKPTGKGADAQMDWEGSMITLPKDIEEAKEVIESCLSDTAKLKSIRLRNVAEALGRHDTRLRIRDILRKLDWKEPETLTEELDTLRVRRDEVAQLRS